MRHVIVGNGPAGVIAAETLRAQRPDDDIIVVGDEPEPPYSRMAIPYLLIGDIGEDGTHLRKEADHFARLRIALRQSAAERIDTQARSVSLQGGDVLPYDRLLLATGSSPADPPIPGIHSPGVLTCWTLADARKIAASVKRGRVCCSLVRALSAASSWRRLPRAMRRLPLSKWATEYCRE